MLTWSADDHCTVYTLGDIVQDSELRGAKSHHNIADLPIIILQWRPVRSEFDISHELASAQIEVQRYRQTSFERGLYFRLEVATNVDSVLLKEGEDIDANDVADHRFCAIEDVDDIHREEIDRHGVVLEDKVLRKSAGKGETNGIDTFEYAE